MPSLSNWRSSCSLAVVIIPGTALVFGYAELKISAHMQSRIGPYFAGGRYGWAQSLADGLKFIQKEDVVPGEADRTVFRWAPAVVLMGTVLLFVIIPLGPDLVVVDLDVGRLLRPRRFVARDHRRADGGLVVRQQVLADRGPARRRSAHRIRASAGPGGGRRRHPGGHDVARRDRGRPGERSGLPLCDPSRSSVS